MEYQIFKTEKDKESILLDGFLFYKNGGGSNSKTYWRCSNYYATQCRARIIIENSTILNRTTEHNHAANAAKVEAIKKMESLRDKSKISSIGSTQEILSDVVSTVSSAASFYMPLKRSMQRSIRKIRQKESIDHLSIPLALKDLIIPETYKYTDKGDIFVLKDTGFENPDIENRIILIATNENIKTLSRCEEYFMDGTFKACPKIFGRSGQLYVIHGLFEGVPLALVYALLIDKSTRTYEKMFQLLLEVLSLNPKKIHIDFEMAMIKALKNTFPSSKIVCCYFHLQKSIYRYLCTLGYKSNYDTDVEFSLQVRTLTALAFVPIDHQEQYYGILIEKNLLSDYQDFVSYFEATYFGTLRPDGVRRAPRFERELWNFYEEARTKRHKTNNISEGFNNALNKIINICNPNIWQLIVGLKKKQSEMEFQKEQLLSHREFGVPQRKNYKNASEYLSSLVGNFEKMDAFEYMKEIAIVTKIDFID